MPSKHEVFDAKSGQRTSVQWYDDNGQPVTEAQAATLGANQSAVKTALAQAIIDMQAILDTAAVPAGTLTTAQLSTVARQLESAVRTTALALKRAARLLNGDFTGNA